MINPIVWTDEAVVLLDQRALPEIETYVELHELDEVIAAIRDLVVRGAPAIGVTAAMGLAQAVRKMPLDVSGFTTAFDAACVSMEAARPTAVNLAWAVRRLRRLVERHLDEGIPAVCARMEKEARFMHAEDIEMNRTMGRHGSVLVPAEACVLTHCNAGALATAGYGTALGVVRAAVEEGKKVSVMADETRPFLQGARLTAWELQRDGIPCTVITDNMAGHLMSRGDVDLVVVGSDRIAANGDVANKIGTYTVAVLAREHGIPFYVAAPTSTVDLAAVSGADIPIEERSGEEVVVIDGKRIAPVGVPALYPAFDITPAKLVDAIVTEEGVARTPYTESLRACCDASAARTEQREAAS